MIDLHTHLLPGVDDGSASLEESLQMAQMAYESGVKALVVTPHCNHPALKGNYYCAQFENRFIELKTKIESKMPIKIYAGMEIYGTYNVPALIKANKLITINNSRYVLIEFGFDESPIDAINILDKVSSIGLTPLIAHPERYEFVQDNVQILYELVDAGYLLQINKGSVLGKFGKSAQKLSKYILSNGMAHVISSDAHSPYQRTTYMLEVYEYICDRYSLNYADRLFYLNPLKILSNQNIYSEVNIEST